MALFPQGKTTLESRCNPGERKLYHALKKHLSDDYIVWHDLPVGDSGLQPDFVILSPRQGLLAIEVKDWKRSTLAAGTDKHRVQLNLPTGPSTSPHPLAQARQHVLSLVDRMQRDALLTHAEGAYQGKLIFPWGWGCALVNMKREQIDDPESFEALFPANRTLLRDDLDESLDDETFGQRLWGMMQHSFSHTLTLPQRDRVRWHLFPTLRVAPEQQVLVPTEANTPAPVRVHDVMHVMDMQQEREARRMGDGHRVIHGVAGSGKTMILIFRAQRLAPAAAAVGRPVLVLCYNRALSDRIRHQLAQRGVLEEGKGVVVRTFHSWCEDMVRTYQIDVGVPRQHRNYFDALAQAVERALLNGFVPKGQYTAVMIDEAHDFEDAWLRMAVELVNPATKALLVLYDHAQALYKRQNRKTPFKALGIDVVGGRRSTVMQINYRNTAEILGLALSCAHGVIPRPSADGAADTPPAADSDLAALAEHETDSERGDHTVNVLHPDSAGRRGPMPVLHETNSSLAEALWQAQRIAQLQAEGVKLSQIAVIFCERELMAPLERALQVHGIAFESMRTLKPRDLDWSREAVRILTAHSAKGLEFSHVLVGAVNAFEDSRNSVQEQQRLLYVAMTRASLWLGLSAHASTPLVARVREQLQALQTHWAEQG